MQTRESGQGARRFGLLMAELVAKKMHWDMVNPGKSNECKTPHGLTVIKTADIGNPKIGVTEKMLPRLFSVTLVKVLKDDSAEVLTSVRNKLPLKRLSSGKNAGHIQFFLICAVEQRGQFIVRLSPEEVEDVRERAGRPRRQHK